jgi:dipeptidase E
MASRRLLLISNSTMFGRGYPDHVMEEIHDLLGSASRIAFVPFALFDRVGYIARSDPG